MFKEIIIFYFIYSFADAGVSVKGARVESKTGKSHTGCGSYFVKQMFRLFSDKKIERKIQQAIKDLKKIAGKENKIAFTAGLQREETYSRLQILKFTKVITNVGGGLNASDGVFYCPEPGLYYFFGNILLHGNDGYAEIYKNDKRVVYVYTDYNGKQWKSGSNAVILLLEQGDRVSVKSYSSYRFHDNATYFTGLKI